MSNKKSDMGKPKSVLMGVIGFIILVLADQWTKKSGGAASEGSGSNRTDKKCI